MLNPTIIINILATNIAKLVIW